METRAWVDGMRDLAVSFPSQDQDQEVLEKRGEIYRRELGSLSDDAWLYAVRESIRNERWFPTVAQLLDYAGRAPVMAPAAALPDDTRTPDEKRADAARMLDTIKAELAAREAELPPTPVVTPPPEPTVVVLDRYPERLDELRRQAREIVEQAETTTVEGGV